MIFDSLSPSIMPLCYLHALEQGLLKQGCTYMDPVSTPPRVAPVMCNIIYEKLFFIVFFNENARQFHVKQHSACNGATIILIQIVYPSKGAKSEKYEFICLRQHLSYKSKMRLNQSEADKNKTTRTLVTNADQRFLHLSQTVLA